MMILKRCFLSSLIIFLFLPVDLSNFSTCFKSFLGFLQLCLINTKSFDARKICTKQIYANNTCIKDILIYASNICTKNVGIESIYIKNIYTKSICSGNACIGASISFSNACIEANICTGGIYIGATSIRNIEDASLKDFDIRNIYIKKTYTRDIYIWGIFTNDNCARSAYSIVIYTKNTWNKV